MVSERIVGRPQYIEQLKKWQSQTDLIKIVTGVRRCGKSKLFYLYQMDLIFDKIADDSQIININLEDLMQTQKIGLEYDKENFLTDYNKLLNHIVKHLNPQKMNYVFIDEVQLLRDWQRVANTLRLQNNVDLYLTGSNAYMFSSDLANQLGGRYVEIKMQPLSFKEYFGAYSQFSQWNINTKQDMLDLHNPIAVYSHYIRESGFPQTLNLLYDKQLISDYLLDTVYLNTIQKDVVKRFNISEVLSNLDIGMIVCDEAHCIDLWGSDFRPDYQKLGSFIKKFPKAKVMALTATAGKATQKVIKEVCNMKSNVKIFKGDLERKNIKYKVIKKEDDGFMQLMECLKPLLDENNKPKTSIFVCLGYILIIRQNILYVTRNFFL